MTHDRELANGDRVVILPRSKNSPGWCYQSSPARGVVVDRGPSLSMVMLDGEDVEREVPTVNLRRACTYRPPKAPARKTALGRPHKPLADGPWDEPTLPFGGDV